jgi:hypothetical protein
VDPEHLGRRHTAQFVGCVEVASVLSGRLGLSLQSSSVRLKHHRSGNDDNPKLWAF